MLTGHYCFCGLVQDHRLLNAIRSIPLLGVALLLALVLLRSPLTLQQPSPEQAFQLPDVLGERMVIPPSTPDFVLLNCGSKQNLQAMNEACHERQATH